MQLDIQSTWCWDNASYIGLGSGLVCIEQDQLIDWFVYWTLTVDLIALVIFI